MPSLRNSSSSSSLNGFLLSIAANFLTHRSSVISPGAAILTCGEVAGSDRLKFYTLIPRNQVEVCSWERRVADSCRSKPTISMWPPSRIKWHNRGNMIAGLRLSKAVVHR